MKRLLVVTLSLISISSFAQPLKLTYDVPLSSEGGIVSENILPINFLELYREFNFEQERMIAGKREVVESKSPREFSWLSKLRKRLDGTKGFNRF